MSSSQRFYAKYADEDTMHESIQPSPRSVDALGHATNSFQTPPLPPTASTYLRSQIETESPRILGQSSYPRTVKSAPTEAFMEFTTPSEGSSNKSSSVPNSPASTNQGSTTVVPHGHTKYGRGGMVVKLVEEFETLDVRVQDYFKTLSAKTSPRGPAPLLTPTRAPAPGPITIPDLTPTPPPIRTSTTIITTTSESMMAGRKRQHSDDLDTRRTRHVSPPPPPAGPELPVNKLSGPEYQNPPPKAPAAPFPAPKGGVSGKKRPVNRNLSAALATASKDAADAAASGAAAARDAATAASNAYAKSKTNTAAARAAARATMAAAKAAAAAATVATAAAAAATAASLNDPMGTLTASGTAIAAAAEVVKAAAEAVNAAAMAEAVTA